MSDQLDTQPEMAVFDDIEAVLALYLTTRMTGWPEGPVTVATNVPDPRPDRLIKITRTGGTQRDRITDLPQVTFECWANLEPEASKLARWARAWVGATAGTAVDGPEGPVWIRAVDEVGGPVFNPDPETRLPRYQFTVQLNQSSHRPVATPPEPDTETLSFDWTIATYYNLGTYAVVELGAGTFPAGRYNWTGTGIEDGSRELLHDVHEPGTPFSVGVAGDTYTWTISGPYDIEFSASGTSATSDNTPVIADSGTVTYTRPLARVDRWRTRHADRA